MKRDIAVPGMMLRLTPCRNSMPCAGAGIRKINPFATVPTQKSTSTELRRLNDEPYVERAEKIDGPALSLTDAEGMCVHARFCMRAGGIWNLTRQSGNPEAREIAIKEAADCPSGRLVVWDKETGKALEPEFEKSIVVIEYPPRHEHGPLWVRGGIPVESSDGHVYEVRNRMTLCRCGKSCNKPFCDGSHVER